MTIKIFFAIVSALVGISCFAPYIKGILNNSTKPHPYSWLMWAILQTTAAISMFESGAGIGIASISIGAFLCFFIFVLSLKYGTKNIATSDTIFLVCAFIALASYFYFHNPLISVILVTLTDFLSFLPTIRKGYQEPYTETISMYALSALSTFLALFALSIFNLTNILYLASLVITNGGFALMIFFRRKSKIT